MLSKIFFRHFNKIRPAKVKPELYFILITSIIKSLPSENDFE